jgi:tetratricopeptide (TPR) repeat protein
VHAANAVLVWVILRRLKIPGAWVAGLVFALHPVNVATVAWITELKNTLSMLFYAGAILLYLRFDEEHRWRWYALSLGAFLLGLLSKSAVVVLPVVLLGCIWWRRGQVRWKDFLHSVPFFVVSLVSGWVSVWIEVWANREITVRATGFLPRLAGAGWAAWFYLYKALLPFDLTMIYPKWEIDASHWVSYAPGVILAGCLGLFWWKRQTWGRPLLFGLGYFAVTLFPVLGFFDISFFVNSLVADHWQYYSIVGVIAMATAGWELIWRRIGEQGRDWRAVTGVAVLLGLAAATWGRCQIYTDSESLWRDNVAKNPNAWTAHYNLGNALLRADRFQDAIGHYEQAVRLKPDLELAHNNLAYALLQMGEVNGAIGHLEQALRVNPNSAEGHCNLGRALLQAGRMEDAIGHYKQAVRIKPDYVEAHYNLGIALVRLGRLTEAVGHWEQAVRIKPDYAEAHYNLGIALVRLGRLQEAMGHWEQALRSKPDYAEAENSLAWLLATLAPADGGDPVRAVTLAERACELTDNRVAAYLDTLAVAYAAAGRFNDAIAAAQKAIELARSAGQTQMVSEIETRLELYRAGRAYRAPESVTRPHGP